MAKLYGLLPSDVASRATTYDLMVTDVLAAYEHYQAVTAQGGSMDPEALNEFYDVDDLKQILDKTREQQHN